jgi:lipopolysaccharide transport system permease protein
MSTDISGYFHRISKARYFWFHLVLSDLRARYRRSFLGIGWAMLHPLTLTCLLGFVMSKAFKSPLADYAPYILSGIILWEFITSSAVTGCQAFIHAEGYIRQISHPLAIYSLRTTLCSLINLSFGFIGLIVWVLFWKPGNVNLSWLALPVSFCIFFLGAWGLSTITAFITVRFRDFSQVIVILLQALWYVSPVFLLPSIFEAAGIKFLLNYNPIYHLLSLFRAPILYGEFPTFVNYLYSFGTVLFLGVLALLSIKISEKKVIFYL